MTAMKSLPMVRAKAFAPLQVLAAAHGLGIPAGVEASVGMARDAVLRETFDGRVPSLLGLVIVEPD